MSGSLDKTETSINVLNAFTECSDNDSSRPWPRWHHVQTQQPDKHCTASIITKSLGSFCFFSGYLSACVVKQLETAGFFSDVPKSKLFVTVHDAVLHILHKVGHTNYGSTFVSTFVTLIEKLRLVAAIKSPQTIAGYCLQHSDVASRGQAAVFFILLQLSAALLLLSIGHHPCLLLPHQRKACHLDMAAGCHGNKHRCCDNGAFL